MTDQAFPDLMAAAASGHATITTGWMQGRAAYGGLGAALAAAAMRAALPETLAAGLSMRSLSVSFVAPIPAGDVAVSAELLRVGKNVAQVSARISDGEQVCLQAAAAFGTARETLDVAPVATFRPEPRDSVPALDARSGMLPPFLRFFDGHWTGGGIPMSGAKDRRLGMWVRHNSDMSAYPAEAIIGIADIPPPVMLSHYSRPVRASSLSWSLEFVSPPESVAADWLYLDYTLEAAAGGYSQQSGLVFTEDGELVALSRQTMTYFE